MRRPWAIVPAAVFLLGLAGCAPAPSPAPTPTPTATPSAAPPEPTPAPAPALVLPDCETLLPLDDARALFGAATEFHGTFPVAEWESITEAPAVDATLASAAQSVACRWIVPNSDGGFTVVAAELAPGDEAAITAALEGAGYVPSRAGGLTSILAAVDNELGTTFEAHRIAGEVWVIAQAPSESTAVGAADSAIEAANP